ncbi:hypothetical protein [Tabrizicola sp. BL-A-41-H6]|uniref:hypothetical protein n=1 Tax=Tabrizicola sp. BL-A-41-H6 TaxID=3421107 RepID=UPI003D66AC9A
MRLLLALCLLATPTLAETTGPVEDLVTAHRLYAQAVKTADTTALLSAIRLARPIAIRPAPGWTVEASAPPQPDEPQGAPAPANPASPETLAIALAFAGEDPALQDLVYDLDVQSPAQPTATITAAASTLGAGQTDTWRIALFGQSPAELAVIGDGDTPLTLTITDDSGATVCANPAAPFPDPCAFTPSRNGFFTVAVTNQGTLTNSYQLLSN